MMVSFTVLTCQVKIIMLKEGLRQVQMKLRWTCGGLFSEMVWQLRQFKVWALFQISRSMNCMGENRR
jgi:hypothetical protein